MRSKMRRGLVRHLLALAGVVVASVLVGCCLLDYLDGVLPEAESGGGFTIEVAPSALTLEGDGAVGSVEVRIIRTGGIAGGVSLEVLDLPSGVIHEVRGTDTAATRTVRFAAFRDAAIGTSAVNVRASCSRTDLVVNHTISLTIKDPGGVPPPSVLRGRFTSISARGYHSLALDEHGNAWAWGWNGFGQLADGSATDRLVPIIGFVSAVGSITRVSAGGLHSVALDDASSTWAAGFNEEGQLGDGTRSPRNVPVPTRLPEDIVLVSVSAGDFHTLALDQHGGAWAWGWNGDGQLGDGSVDDRSAPVRVHVPAGTTFTSVAAGGFHSVAIDEEGAAWGWGANEHGEVGDGTRTRRVVPVPVAMPAGVSFTSVAAGEQHSVALDQHGRAWSWGRNDHGQLGDGNSGHRRVPGEVSMPALVTFSRVSAGGFHTLALDVDGRAWAWGRNSDGQLGDTNLSRWLPARAPVQVDAPEAITFVDVAAGYHHSMAVDDLGNAWAWGLNRSGQLGIGSLDDERRSPTAVRMP